MDNADALEFDARQRIEMNIVKIIGDYASGRKPICESCLGGVLRRLARFNHLTAQIFRLIPGQCKIKNIAPLRVNSHAHLSAMFFHDSFHNRKSKPMSFGPDCIQAAEGLEQLAAILGL